LAPPGTIPRPGAESPTGSTKTLASATYATRSCERPRLAAAPPRGEHSARATERQATLELDGSVILPDRHSVDGAGETFAGDLEPAGARAPRPVDARVPPWTTRTVRLRAEPLVRRRPRRRLPGPGGPFAPGPLPGPARRLGRGAGGAFTPKAAQRRPGARPPLAGPSAPRRAAPRRRAFARAGGARLRLRPGANPGGAPLPRAPADAQSARSLAPRPSPSGARPGARLPAAHRARRAPSSRSPAGAPRRAVRALPQRALV